MKKIAYKIAPKYTSSIETCGLKENYYFYPSDGLMGCFEWSSDRDDTYHPIIMLINNAS